MSAIELWNKNKVLQKNYLNSLERPIQIKFYNW